jgi:copper resistance protein D
LLAAPPGAAGDSSAGALQATGRAYDTVATTAPAPMVRSGTRVATSVAWLQPTSFPRSATRWVSFVALLGIIGAAAFRWLLLRPLARQGVDPLFTRAVAPRVGLTGVVLSVFLLASAGMRLLFESFGLVEGATLGDLLRTGWGQAWLFEVGWGAVALLAFALARRGSEAAWAAAAAAAIALAFAPGLGGHAAAAPRLVGLSVLADGAHVLGAGAWLGTLFLIVGVGLRSAAELEPTTRHRTVAALVHRFSPAALAFASLVVLSGLVSTWLRAESLRALWYSGYGSVLGWKLVLFAFVLLAGLYNWQKVRPKLGTGELATERLRRTGKLELLSSAAVLALTAVLVATPPPVSTVGADRPVEAEGDGPGEGAGSSVGA